MNTGLDFPSIGGCGPRLVNRSTHRTLATLAAVLIAYGGTCAYLYLIQDQLVFYPNRAHGVSFNESVTTFEIPVDETEDIWTRGYIVNASAPGPVVVYFAGNGAESAYQAPALQQIGATVVLTNYRGYGGSDGTPSEQAILSDAERIISWVESDFPDRPLVLLGYSLGSGVAVAASSKETDAVILIAPYRSLAEIARANPVYRLFPVDWLMKHRFDTRAFVNDLPSRVLVIYSRLDRVTPPEESLKFCSLVPHARVVEVETDHDSLVTHPYSLAMIRKWLQEEFH